MKYFSCPVFMAKTNGRPDDCSETVVQVTTTGATSLSQKFLLYRRALSNGSIPELGNI
jgi:hypothetical protein